MDVPLFAPCSLEALLMVWLFWRCHELADSLKDNFELLVKALGYFKKMQLGHPFLPFPTPPQYAAWDVGAEIALRFFTASPTLLCSFAVSRTPFFDLKTYLFISLPQTHADKHRRIFGGNTAKY